MSSGFFPIFPTISDLQDDFDSVEDFKTNWAVRAFKGKDSDVFREGRNLIPFGTAFSDLSELYIREALFDEATELHLRYRVGRDWMGLDHLVAKAYGLKGLSIANPVPGYRLYPVDPIQVAARRKARAMGIMPAKPFD